MQDHDIAIVGAGPVGLTLALALSHTHHRICLIDSQTEQTGHHKHTRADRRILALSFGSYQILARLGLNLEAVSDIRPIHTIHVSQQGGLGRTVIRAEDEGIPSLGYVVEAGVLIHLLEEAVQKAVQAGKIRRYYDTHVINTRINTHAKDGNIEIETQNAQCLVTQYTAKLLAFADGTAANSDEKVISKDYKQDAILSIVDINQQHNNIAWERFTPTGPIALLPIAGQRYALVYVCPREETAMLLSLSDTAFLRRLQDDFGSRVQFTTAEPRSSYPLMLRYRQEPIAARCVWLGNAAQTLHPVMGQGLNLGLRDVWALSDLLRHTGNTGSTGSIGSVRNNDPGSEDSLRQYVSARQIDRRATIGFTDTIIRMFSSANPLLQHGRGMGLLMLDLIPPARGFLARRMLFGARAW